MGSFPDNRPSFLAEGTAAGLLFLASPGAGYFLGKWAGQWLGLESVLAWIGAGLGLAGAFVHLFRLVARISR